MAKIMNNYHFGGVMTVLYRRGLFERPVPLDRAPLDMATLPQMGGQPRSLVMSHN